jgi:hypothetical protein
LKTRRPEGKNGIAQAGQFLALDVDADWSDYRVETTCEQGAPYVFLMFSFMTGDQRWDGVCSCRDWKSGHRTSLPSRPPASSLHVRRVKNGKPSVHPLRSDEIRALRELSRQFSESAFVFATERDGPFTADAVNRLIKRIGARAGFAFPVHAHMLRHGCGSRWPTRAMIRALFRIGSGIGRSSNCPLHRAVADEV